MSKKKIALIGGGQIGQILALLATQKQLGEIVVYDVVEGMPQGKALDLMEFRPIDNYDAELYGTQDYADCAGSDVVIVTAGVPRKPGMSRDDLLDVNLKIIKEVAAGLKKHCPDSFIIVVSNPLDVMVTALQQITGFPKSQIVGMAGMLDTARFRAFVAMELGYSVKDVQALVMGGHGPTMVPIVRTATVSGIPIEELLPKDKIEAIVDRTRKAGTEIVSLLKTGSAFFSPAAACITMAESYMYDRKRIMPCSALLTGEYGVNGYFLGVPVLIGAGGMEKVIEVSLTEEEQTALADSAEHVKKVADEAKSKL